MLSIGKLAPGPDAASYYLERVGCPLDYVGRGELAGVWMGKGAQGMRLFGALDTQNAEQGLRGLLDGSHRTATGWLVKPFLRADPRSRVPTASPPRPHRGCGPGAPTGRGQQGH